MPVGVGAAGACVYLHSRNRNMYHCLYKLNAWRMCNISKLKFAFNLKWCSWMLLCWTWLKVGYCNGLWGESTRGKGDRKWSQPRERMLREDRMASACGCASGKNGKRSREKEERAEEKQNVWPKIWARWMLKHAYRPVLNVWHEAFTFCLEGKDEKKTALIL